MESLFGYVPANKNKNEHKKDSSSFDSPQFIQIIDSKKAQNLAILLKALNVSTEEVCDAVKEGDSLSLSLSLWECERRDKLEHLFFLLQISTF